MNFKSRIFIAWKLGSDRGRKGAFLVRNGSLTEVTVHQGEAVTDGNRVEMRSCVPVCLELGLELSDAPYGAAAPVVQWVANEESFAFLPMALPEQGCIQVPDFGVVIGRSLQAVEAADAGSCTYDEALKRGGFPKGREIGWDAWAARNNRSADVPTVLGLSRDQRMFIIDPTGYKITASIDLIKPTVSYIFARSSTPERRCMRSLEDGYLPILHSRENSGDIVIEDTLFATFIDRPLTLENLAGTPFKVAHLGSSHCTFPPGMKETAEEEAATNVPQGELVLFMRTRLTNRSDIHLVTPQHLPTAMLVNSPQPNPQKMQPLDKNGVCWLHGLPLSMHRVNGMPPASLQPSLLLAPGASMTIDSILSHRSEGLSEEVQKRGMDLSWEAKLAETKTFWHDKLRPAASVSLPESRLADFWKAGLLHLDLITLGKAKEGPLLAKVGIYAAIGSESIPIIEFYDSVGLHDLARRSLDAFFELQQNDGRINLFSHYDIETAGVLFMAGRHFAYTHNKEWVANRVKPIKLAADYVLGMRQLESSEAFNYGLLVGTCADPVEMRTTFMLSAYGAAGVLAVAEMLEAISDSEASKYREVADEFVAVYRKAFVRSFEGGPLVPTAQGRWVPTCAPTIEGIGLEMMGLKGESAFTHRTYAAFDALLGPLYGVFSGVIKPEEKEAQWLLEVNHAQLNRACITESQPYYGRHPEVHLMRGEREAFLNAFYSGLTSLADRDTFSFWEHLYQVSIHKTHEEAWALMQLRRMLWLERGRELRLLPGISEEWLDPGKSIEVKGGGSYFGKISFRVERAPEANNINLRWEADFHTSPESVCLYLPGVVAGEQQDGRLSVHPEGWVEIAEPAKPLNACLSLH